MHISRIAIATALSVVFLPPADASPRQIVPAPKAAMDLKSVWRLPDGARIVPSNPCWKNGLHAKVALTPDGKKGLLGEQGAVRVFDLEQGLQIRSLNGAASAGAAGKVDAFAVFDDGRSVVAIDNSDDTVRVWDIETGSLKSSHALGRAPAGNGPSLGIASVSPDQRYLLLQDSIYGVTLFDMKGAVDGAPSAFGRYPVQKLGRYGKSLAVSADWRIALNAYSVGAGFDLLDFPAGAKLYSFNLGLMPEGLQLALTPDGKTAALAFGGTIVLWDVKNRKAVRHFQMLPPTYRSPQTFIDTMALASDMVLIGDARGGARAYDAETGALLATYVAKGSCIGEDNRQDDAEAWAAFTPDGLYTGEGDISRLLKVVRDEGAFQIELPKEEFLTRNRRLSLTAEIAERRSAARAAQKQAGPPKEPSVETFLSTGEIRNFQ